MAPRPAPIAPARNAPLDGLRALAALSVLCFHVWLYGPDFAPGARKTLADKIMFELNLGLICFFVLSGFLLYRGFARAALSSGPRVAVKDYAIRRAARIMPAYYLCLAGCLLLFWAVGLTELIPATRNLPLFAAFGQNFSADTVMHFNPVTWTLSIEASLYLVLPLIGLAAHRFGPRRVGFQAALLVSLIALTLAWNAIVFIGDWRPVGPKTLPAYLGHFALGMLAALWFEQRRRTGARAPGPVATAILVSAGAGLVLLGAYWHETTGRSLFYSTFAGLPAAAGFALVIAAAAAGSGPAVGWLRARPLVAVGLISYGIYLWHLPLLLATRQLGLLPDALALRAIIVLTISLLAATASWLLVEQPLMRRFDPGRGRSGAGRHHEMPLDLVGVRGAHHGGVRVQPLAERNLA